MREIVITGVGVVSPIGVGRAPFWSSLSSGRSGIRKVSTLNPDCWPAHIGGEVTDFEPKGFVRPRKSLKVMSADIKFAYAAADLACQEGQLEVGAMDSERLGVVFGADMICCDLEEIVSAYRGCIVDGKFEYSRWGEHALSEMYPLWLLKYLPNMAACHVGISRNARGPTNSVMLGEASSLAALIEGIRVIDRGRTDAMVVGGTGARIHPSSFAFRGDRIVSRRNGDPTAVCRPFDAGRDGAVYGEGAAAFLMEERQHAERRGAKIRARVLGHASTFQSDRRDGSTTGHAIRASIEGALRSSGLSADEIGHVNANGMSLPRHDAIEAQAIRDTLGDVPVVAFKSYFGDLGAGTGAVEMAASVMALENGRIPATLNYQTPDETCPVNVVQGQGQPVERPTAMLLNQSMNGQAVAVVIASDQSA